ncbi:dihydroxyacetone kinase subunit DhaL [Tessaracoccus lacteus]|uniref:Dihydroxyacetone kinase subunit DhaL n=1 Tax=Tessaracoccus lacteus TaxID=3041766 RepID=A0ABY8PZY8_9ACTN|nr:dihydroxyacetone kinase subunit DhaL [Tessaracoccus sp. T21]WGT47821.1 dihydroxyacetone kinase subunit DhaL [Tessaracoccus sp. T21]
MPTVAAVSEWLDECTHVFEGRVDELNELDGILGDGDHGTNMYRGFAAARRLDLSECPNANDAMRQVGMSLVGTVGGASGPLFGTLLLRVGATWPDHLTLAGVAASLRQGTNGVMARGKAVRGDKTMVDVLLPALDSLEADARRGADLESAILDAVDAADEARDATAAMVAHRGRSALKSESSVGVVDPGAVSTALILRTGATRIREELRARTAA